MLGLRTYLPADGELLASWVQDEDTYRMWSAYLYKQYPLSADEVNASYSERVKTEGFFPFTAFDENGPIGHMIMRWTDTEHKTLRFGFIIVDSSRRGKGYGRRMIELALRYARDKYSPERITLGVFEDNLPAARCYRALGFKETGETELIRDKWKVVEMEYILRPQEDADCASAAKFSLEMLAPCGLNCTLCRSALRKESPCKGCRGPQQHKSHYCTEICRIWTCEKLAETNGFCDRCPDYPCKELQDLEQRYATKYPLRESPAQNLADIRSLGAEFCVETHRLRWSCPSCGGVICVHTGQCSQCAYTPDPERF
ncbi:MAG: GNAT family N-acetyltransferase [Ruminococcaceae bacterium]|nr:GNAT family N-acetyltransferase [Oscillospiraceae bacterium]